MAGRHSGGIRPQRQRNHPPSVLGSHNLDRQALLLDQKEMAADYGILKHEIAAAHQELRKLDATVHQVKEEKESRVKQLFEKSLDLEREIRAIDALKSEHAQVVSDIQNLTESKIQLAAQFKALDAELCRVKEDASQLPLIQSDVENFKQEIKKGRAAVKFERKTRLDNLELSCVLEGKINSMQQEIEMLRAELSNAEKRARAAAAAASNPNPGQIENYGSYSMTYGGPYSMQYSLNQGQLPEGPSSAVYGRPPGSHGSHDVQHPHQP
ncbi:unnamed protein product [Amaranthus hypochondriacus]